MNKKIIFVCLIVLCLLVGCGTNNKETSKNKDAIEGYELVSTIECEALSKEIEFINDKVIITKEKEAYAYNLDTKYSNGTNCAKFDDLVEVTTIDGDTVYEKTKQVKFNVNDLTISKSSFDLIQRKMEPIQDKGYYLFMSGPTKEGLSNTSYAIKKDGNEIFSFQLSLGRRKAANGFYQSYYKIEKEAIDYSAPAGEIIKAFAFHKKEDDFLKDFILTDKSYFSKRITNLDDCQNYVDIKCEYELYKNETLTKIINKLIYVYDNLLITKEGKVYNKK